MKTLIATVLMMMLMLPAQAHSEAELESWLMEFERMKTETPVPAEPTLAFPIVAGWEALLADMEQRHPCSKVLETWSDACERTVVVHRGSGYTGMGSNVEQWRPLVASYSWDVDIALCLMAKESGGNPGAYNPSGASGLMQVLASWADDFGYQPADLFVPEVNISIAYALYADGGWSHWSPWKRGECH